MRQSVGFLASATRATMLASSHAAADAMATQSTPRNAKTTTTAIGARAKTTSDSQRHMPRWERKKNAAARLTTAAAAPAASIVRLLSPAKSSRITIAAPASTKLRRASQRWAGVLCGLSADGTAAARQAAEIHVPRPDRHTPQAPAPHPFRGN